MQKGLTFFDPAAAAARMRALPPDLPESLRPTVGQPPIAVYNEFRNARNPNLSEKYMHILRTLPSPDPLLALLPPMARAAAPAGAPPLAVPTAPGAVPGAIPASASPGAVAAMPSIPPAAAAAAIAGATSPVPVPATPGAELTFQQAMEAFALAQQDIDTIIEGYVLSSASAAAAASAQQPTPAPPPSSLSQLPPQHPLTRLIYMVSQLAVRAAAYRDDVATHFAQALTTRLIHGPIIVHRRVGTGAAAVLSVPTAVRQLFLELHIVLLESLREVAPTAAVNAVTHVLRSAMTTPQTTLLPLPPPSATPAAVAAEASPNPPPEVTPAQALLLQQQQHRIATIALVRARLVKAPEFLNDLAAHLTQYMQQQPPTPPPPAVVEYALALLSEGLLNPLVAAAQVAAAAAQQPPGTPPPPGVPRPAFTLADAADLLSALEKAAPALHAAAQQAAAAVAAQQQQQGPAAQSGAGSSGPAAEGRPRDDGATSPPSTHAARAAAAAIEECACRVDRALSQLRRLPPAALGVPGGAVAPSATGTAAPSTAAVGPTPSQPAQATEELRAHVLAQFDGWLKETAAQHHDERIDFYFLQKFKAHNLLKGDEMTDWLIRTLTEVAVRKCLESATAPDAAVAPTPSSGGASTSPSTAFSSVTSTATATSTGAAASQQVSPSPAPSPSSTAAAPSDAAAPRPPSGPRLRFDYVDGVSRIISLLVRWGVPSDHARMAELRRDLLRRLLVAVAQVLYRDHETSGVRFNQRPYFRIFSNLLVDCFVPEPTSDQLEMPYLSTFATIFHQLSPHALPAFAFAYLSLISHRNFMPKLINSKGRQGWPHMHRLLFDLLVFMEPPLRRIELTPALRALYQGTMRTLLVLLHDFPEFLCEYHFSLCEVTPTTCVQLRNVILSAFPRDVQLPDPFMPNLKVAISCLLPLPHSPSLGSSHPQRYLLVHSCHTHLSTQVDLLPASRESPPIRSAYLEPLEACTTVATVTQPGPIDPATGLPGPSTTQQVTSNLRLDLESFVRSRQPANFLQTLPNRLFLSDPARIAQRGTRYNTPLIASLVLYTGILGLQPWRQKGPLPHSKHTPSMDIFYHLVMCLDSEGRYLLLNAIANQLRYPNAHTHYFSCALLYLYLSDGATPHAQDGAVAPANPATPRTGLKELITRVLLERLIVNRPHPWGLLITFIELIKNPRYKFWQQEFIHCAPELESLFNSVAKSCLGDVPGGGTAAAAAASTASGTANTSANPPPAESSAATTGSTASAPATGTAPNGTAPTMGSVPPAGGTLSTSPWQQQARHQ